MVGLSLARTVREQAPGGRMFALTLADGAVTVNPVGDATAPLNTAAKKAPRALTRTETDRLVELLRGSPHAVALDPPDRRAEAVAGAGYVRP